MLNVTVCDVSSGLSKFDLVGTGIDDDARSPTVMSLASNCLPLAQSEGFSVRRDVTGGEQEYSREILGDDEIPGSYVVAGVAFSGMREHPTSQRRVCIRR